MPQRELTRSCQVGQKRKREKREEEEDDNNNDHGNNNKVAELVVSQSPSIDKVSTLVRSRCEFIIDKNQELVFALVPAKFNYIFTQLRRVIDAQIGQSSLLYALGASKSAHSASDRQRVLLRVRARMRSIGARASS